MLNQAEEIYKRLSEIDQLYGLSAVSLDEERIESLNNLIEHLYNNSKYFKEIVNIHLGSLKLLQSLNDLNLYPIISKSDMRKHSDELFCANYPTDHGEATTFATSGSTGQPTQVVRTERCEIEWMASCLRDHYSKRRDFSKIYCRIIPNVKEINLLENWCTPITYYHSTGTCLIIPSTLEIQQILDAILYHKPNYIQVFPSIILEILKYTHQAGKLGFIEEVILFGETSNQQEREYISSILSCRVSDMYSSTEVGIIATSCAKCGMYHVMSDRIILEIIDEENKRCQEGDIGRVIITDLTNFATPIFRYEIGDYAEVGAGCADSFGMPTIKNIMGRHRNLMSLPDGRKFWPSLGPAFRASTADIPFIQYRVDQLKADTLEVSIATERKIDDETLETLTNNLKIALNYNYTIKYKLYFRNLPRIRGEKFEIFKNYSL